MTVPPEDWIAVLDALVKNDPLAVAKVTSVITAFLARYGAYAIRDSWDDISQEVLIRLLNSHRRGAIREPAAIIRYTETITRNLFLDWIEKEKRQADLPERLERDDGPSDPDDFVDLRRILEDLDPSIRERSISRDTATRRPPSCSANRRGLSGVNGLGEWILSA